MSLSSCNASSLGSIQPNSCSKEAFRFVEWYNYSLYCWFIFLFGYAWDTLKLCWDNLILSSDIHYKEKQGGLSEVISHKIRADWMSGEGAKVVW